MRWTHLAFSGLFYWLIFGQLLWLAWAALTRRFDDPAWLITGFVVTYLACLAVYLRDEAQEGRTHKAHTSRP